MSIDLTQDFFTLFGLRHRYAIDDAALERLAQPLAKSGYGQYLLGLLTDEVRS